MSNWLVLDLRGNQCAVGLLSVRDQGQPDWRPKNFLNVYVSADTTDWRSAADLAFFRAKGQKRWKPALSDVLRDRGLKGQDKIEALFDEPIRQLPDLLPYTLGVLLGWALTQLPVPVLALLDGPKAQEPLDQLLSCLGREVKLEVLEGSGQAYAGFALWDTGDGAVPPAGAQWFCSVPRSDQRQNVTGGSSREVEHEYRRYTWTGTRFSLGRARTPPPGVEDLAQRLSDQELERVGAAIFALHWRDALLGAGQVDAKTLYQELEEREGLLAQLNHILQALRRRGSGSALAPPSQQVVRCILAGDDHPT